MNEIWEWVELITIARTSMSWTNNAMNGMNEIWEWVELITIARTSYAPPLVPTAPCSFLKSLMWRCSRIHLVLWLQRTRVSKFVTSTNSQITWWIASGIPRWWTARRREMLFHIGGTILQAIHLLICLIHVLVLSVSQCVCVCVTISQLVRHRKYGHRELGPFHGSSICAAYLWEEMEDNGGGISQGKSCTRYGWCHGQMASWGCESWDDRRHR